MEPHANPPYDVDQRLTELEIKLSYTEVLVDQLDQVVIRQQQQINALVREIADLRQAADPVAAGMARSPDDELPPHF